MIFDWTITLGSLLSSLAVILTAAAGVFRFVTNHLQHFEERLNLRFDSIDKDIRELREWTIIMRGSKRNRH